MFYFPMSAHLFFAMCFTSELSCDGKAPTYYLPPRTGVTGASFYALLEPETSSP